MDSWKRRIFAFFLILYLACAVNADLVQIYPLDTGRHEFFYSPQQSDTKQKVHAGEYVNPISSINGFDLRAVRFPPETDNIIQQANQESPIVELKHEPGSFTLCLYALMGVGLCSAPHWFRRLSLSYVPEWYHSGGPYQVGHSFAIAPDFHHTAPVLHFIQPDNIKEDYIPRYRTGLIVSLWRESQFTPEKIASRAPPFIA